MEISKLTIKNFMRIKDAKLSFNNKDIIGIIAQGDKDKDRSNYLGKTSVLEAIRYTLTGESRASKETNLIHHGEDMMEVCVYVKDSNGKEHKIRRGRDSKNNGILDVSFNEKVAEGQKAINDLLGIDKSDFDQIFYFKQQEINEFMNLTPDKKKKLLMSWLKNNHWKEKEEQVLLTVKDFKDKISQKNIILKNEELGLGNESQLRDEQSLLESKLENAKIKLESNLRKIQELSSSPTITVQEYKNKNNMIHGLKVEVEDIDKKLLQLDVLKAEFKNKKSIIEKHEDLDNQIQLNENKLEEINNECGSLKERISKKEEVYKKLSISGNGICPIIEEECDRIKLSKKQLEEKKKDIESDKSCFSELKDKEYKLKDKIKELKNILNLKNELEILKSKIQKLIDLQKQKEGIKVKIKEGEEILSRFDTGLSKKLDELKEEKLFLESEISTINKSIGAIELKVSQFDQKQSTIQALKEELIDLNSKLSHYQYVAFMFGPKGIPSLEIENSFQQIEDDANFILNEINPNTSLIFKPNRELSTWEENCSSCGFAYPKGYRKGECESCATPRFKKKKDELRLVVVENGNEMEFDMCSGGLKTIISLAVRAALSLLIKRQMKSNFSVLFLDEIDSALDATHRELIKELVVKVFINKLGFSQVFWISHNKAISESIPHTLLVKGYEAYSELEWL